jgi:hypothetical protein
MLGMRGSGDWVTNQAPESYREGILYEYPNGTAPLTAILSMLKSERETNNTFHWWTKSLASQGGAVTLTYTDAAMSSAYASGGTAGSYLYVKVAAAVANEVRAGHQVLLRDASNLDVDVNALVTSVIINGASSQIAVKLLEADDNSGSNDLSDCDTILIVGNMNADGAAMPDAIAYDPTEWTNYIQTFRTPVDMSRIAAKNKLRTGDQIKEAKREALELHSIEIEKALLYGIGTSGTGANGKPIYSTTGLIAATKAGGVNANYTTDADYSGDAWLTSGELWLDKILEQIFRYGTGEKMAFVGSGTLLAINQLAKQGGQIQLQPTTVAYGLKVWEWITPFGSIYMKTHPLFSLYAASRYSMVIFEPASLTYKYIDDTHYVDRKASTTNDVEIFGEFMTDCGLEYHFPTGWGWLNGFGQLNVV